MKTLIRKPFLLWGIYLLSVLVIALLMSTVFPDLRSGPSGLSVLQLVAQALLTLLPLPFVAALGWSNTGFKGPRQWRDLHVLAFPVFTVVFGYLAGFRPLDLPYLATALALVALVALGEEMAFRGVILRALLPRGVWPAVLISSAMFGLMHLVNLALGAPWKGVLLQVLFSAMGGVGFAAMTIRTNTIWSAIALHAFYDLAFRVGDFTPFSWFSNTYFMLHGLGWVVLAVIILRPAALVRNPTPAGSRARGSAEPL